MRRRGGDAMPALLDLQRAFRIALLTDAGEAVAESIVARGIAPLARLAIYRNNVTGNLTGALRLSFPAVERLVGADFFAAAAARFLAAAQPRQANLYDWGDAFPDFLRSFQPAAPLPYLADVARLEWVIGRALHAPATPALDPQALAGMTPAQQAAVCFRRHPSVSLLTLAHPAHRIWQAVLAGDDGALAGIDPSGGGECLAVHRAAEGADVLRLSPAGLRFAAMLCAGAALCAALEVADAATAAGLLSAFLARGLFSGVCAAPLAPTGSEAAELQEIAQP